MTLEPGPAGFARAASQTAAALAAAVRKVLRALGIGIPNAKTDFHHKHEGRKESREERYRMIEPKNIRAIEPQSK